MGNLRENKRLLRQEFKLCTFDRCNLYYFTYLSLCFFIRLVLVIREWLVYFRIFYLTLLYFTMKDSYKRFADKYFETLNATKSAIYAGFSEDTAKQQGWQLLQKPEIDQYIQKLREEYAEKSGISKEWIVERFKNISDRCVQAEPVFDKDGIPTGEYRFDSSGANNATAHLGKILGVFEKDNQQKKTENVIGIMNIDPLSDATDNGTP